MKKIFFAFTLVSFAIFSAYSAPTNHVVSDPLLTNQPSDPGKPPRQNSADNAGKRVSIGISFGLGPDWMYSKTDSIENNGTVLNLKYGVPIDINFTTKNNYYFTTGLFFNHSGCQLNFVNTLDDGLLVPTKRKCSAIYLAIPTGIKLKTPSMSNFVIAAQFGLSHAFRLSAKRIDKCEVNDEKYTSKKTNCTEETALFRESGFIGAGLEYIIKDDFRCFFYATYSHAFTNFFNPNKSHLVSNDIKDKGNIGSVEFTLGVCF